jgi:hypothetical protein
LEKREGGRNVGVQKGRGWWARSRTLGRWRIPTQEWYRGRGVLVSVKVFNEHNVKRVENAGL